MNASTVKDADIVQILDKALEILQGRETWTRLSLARNAKGEPVEAISPEAKCFCLAGAIYKSHLELKSAEDTWQETMHVLNQLCLGLYQKGIQKYGSLEDLQEFKLFPISYTNDALINSAQEARSLLERAKQALQKRGRKKGEPPVAGSPAEAAEPSGELQTPFKEPEPAPDNTLGDTSAGGLELSLQPVEQDPDLAAQAEQQPPEAEQNLSVELPKLEVDIPFSTSHGLPSDDEEPPKDPKS